MKLKAPRFLPSTPMFRDPRLFSSFKARLEDSTLKATMCKTPVRFETLFKLWTSYFFEGKFLFVLKLWLSDIEIKNLKYLLMIGS